MRVRFSPSAHVIHMSLPKILVILGPTASGKSALAVELARELNGEVVSADSRQVYTGLNIGAGKITPEEMKGVPHHLLDVVSPTETFTVEQFKQKAFEAIDDILKRGKLPIICGGSGFYIDAVVRNVSFPSVAANEELRAELQKLSAEELHKHLTELDSRRAQEIDPHNKRRLIRAIEIAREAGSVPEIKSEPRYEALQIGIQVAPEILKKRIHERLITRMKQGMVEEARTLRADGLSLERMEELGLEYRYLARHISGTLSEEELIAELDKEIYKFARRQMTWFKRDTNIEWTTIEDISVSKITERVRKFLI